VATYPGHNLADGFDYEVWLGKLDIGRPTLVGQDLPGFGGKIEEPSLRKRYLVLEFKMPCLRCLSLDVLALSE